MLLDMLKYSTAETYNANEFGYSLFVKTDKFYFFIFIKV